MLRIFIIVAAVFSGVLTWWVFSNARMERNLATEETKVVQETVEVLIFDQQLPRGTRLTNASVRWQEQLRNSVVSDALVRETGTSNAHALDGKLLRTDVAAGEPVRPSMLVSGSASYMALAVTPGMRAVAIRITPEKLAGGFILPDDRVDIIHTIVRDIDEDGVPSGFSRTILHSVRVLAVGQQSTQRNVFRSSQEQDAAEGARKESMAVGETVTLEANHDQAELLIAAAAAGQISLSLRPIEDHIPTQIGDLTTLEKARPAQPDPQAKLNEALQTTVPEDSTKTAEMASAAATVTIIEAGTIRTVTVPQSNN